MLLSKEELQKIKLNLKPADKKKLAEDFDLKPGTIRNILNGTNQNADVLEAAVAMALENKASDQVKVASIQKSILAL